MDNKELRELIEHHISEVLEGESLFGYYIPQDGGGIITELKKQMTDDIIYKGSHYQMHEFGKGKDIDEVIDLNEIVIYGLLGDYEDDLWKLEKKLRDFDNV